MDPLVLFALFPSLVRATAGRRIARVLPVGRRGLHLVFDGPGPGLRLDTGPGRGAALLLAASPTRVRGGRGAWLDLAAALDRDLAGAPSGEPRVGGAPATLEWASPGAALLHLVCAREGGALRVETPGSLPRTIPDGRREPRVEEDALRSEVATLAETWRAALAGSAEELPGRLAAAVPGLGPRAAARLVDRARRAADPAKALDGVAARLEGRDGPAAVSGLGHADEPPCVAWRDKLRIELIVVPGAAGELVLATLPDAVAAWYRAALAGEELGARRDAAERLARRELERARRALAAIARDEAAARPAEELRRLADALLAAGPGARALPAGPWQVADPWDPARTLEIPREPPGAAPHETAARLYARARREERGRAARAARRGQLAERGAALERLLAGAAEADLEPEVEALEEDLRRLGIAVGRGLEAVAAAGRGPGTEGGGARLQRSPSGFVVLAGRSARQNDALTFRTAAPDDLWFHVLGRPGAHVLIRTGGRTVPEADVLFAAGLAATLSGVPRGEAVDVTVARRRHLRRPRGGAPGQVLVSRGRTVRVRAGESPPSPSDPR
ncbi:MAG: hypothetical protein MUF27_06835 [Acidobacteria bacterium]|jgi:hypothetical protein|nr:hypothetical protein [Acidobacteriota bacterium]